MALPKLVHPRFDITIPSSGKKVKFRPFTVREEKLLLMAREAKDVNMIVDTYKQIITNCVEGDFNIEELAMFDIEYFFLKLRAKSVSNISTIIITDPVDEQEYTVDVDLDAIEITRDADHKSTFMLTDDLGIKMCYPTFEAIQAYEKAARAAGDDEELGTRNGSFATVRSCMESLFQGDEVFYMKDQTTEEIDQFIADLTAEQLRKIRTFMDTMPRVEHVVNYTRKDGTESSITLSGLQSFF